MDTKAWLDREVHTLYEITRAINSGLSQHDVLNTMLERIVSDLGYRAATIRLLDQERHELVLKAAFGLSMDYLGKGRVEVPKSATDQRVLTGEPVSIDQVNEGSGFQYADAAAREGLISMLAVPLAGDDQVIGVLHLYTSERHVFTPEETAFLCAIANLGAQAIRRSRFFDSIQRMTQNVNSSLDLQVVLGKLLQISVSELNVMAGSIRLLGPKRETLHLAAASGLSDEYLQKGTIKVAQSPIDQSVLDEGRPVAITDLMKEDVFQYPEEARLEGIRSVYVLPLRVKERRIGVMRLYSGKVRKFNPEEEVFAAAVADMGAVAIENAKLHVVLRERFKALKKDVNGWYQYLAFS